jgi:hypothetical protein
VSSAAAGAKPPERSYSYSAFETDAIVSMIVGSYSISGSWGASRSITPTPGRSIYRHVSRSIISSTVSETRAEEDPATSAVGGGP